MVVERRVVDAVVIGGGALAAATALSLARWAWEGFCGLGATLSSH